METGPEKRHQVLVVEYCAYRLCSTVFYEVLFLVVRILGGPYAIGCYCTLLLEP